MALGHRNLDLGGRLDAVEAHGLGEGDGGGGHLGGRLDGVGLGGVGVDEGDGKDVVAPVFVEVVGHHLQVDVFPIRVPKARHVGSAQGLVAGVLGVGEDAARPGGGVGDEGRTWGAAQGHVNVAHGAYVVLGGVHLDAEGDDVGEDSPFQRDVPVLGDEEGGRGGGGGGVKGGLLDEGDGGHLRDPDALHEAPRHPGFLGPRR